MKLKVKNELFALNAKNMRFIESLSIKKAKNPLLLKENVDMIANNQDMEDKRNLFSEKRPKLPKKLL